MMDDKIIAAWMEASKDLDFRFTARYAVTDTDGVVYEYLGLVHEFGCENGTLIGSADTCPEGNSLERDYFLSLLGDGYGQYDRQMFVDTLNDWQWFGKEVEKPVWYTGKPWS